MIYLKTVYVEEWYYFVERVKCMAKQDPNSPVAAQDIPAVITEDMFR